jgi:hypothetical protein
MNAWPRAADFALMLQNQHLAFKDPRLRACKIARDAGGQPLGFAGAAAVVFRATLEDGRDVALKVFTRPAPERIVRYGIVAEYLRTQPSVAALAGVELLESGMRALDGKFYPLLLMDWISGDVLYAWLRRMCAEGRRAELAQAARSWLALVDELAAANIAHGDLQHGNIVVAGEGHLRLLDYDSTCVPQLVGRQNAELGTKPYRHPGRNKDTLLSPAIDHYPALFIYVVLRALAVEPRLWTKHVEESRYDKLLIRPQDLTEPRTSALYRDLVALPDAETTRLAKALFELYHAPYNSVPALREVIGSCQVPVAPVEPPAESRTKASPDGVERPLVFISAKSEDFPLAREVYDFLTGHGVRAFLSNVTLRERGNSDYVAEIDRALDEARHMIVVASSRQHVDSSWVAGEWRLFINEKRSGHKAGNLVTVITENLSPRDLPASLRYFEVLPFGAEVFQKLLNYVR